MCMKQLALLMAALTIGRPPRKLCNACYTASQNHPAGPLRRYTRRRDRHGLPHCHRHKP